jgi:hypothetical protein
VLSVKRGEGGPPACVRYAIVEGMPPAQIERPSGSCDYGLDNKFLQRRFWKQVRGYETALSIGDNLADWVECYGSIFYTLETR